MNRLALPTGPDGAHVTYAELSAMTYVPGQRIVPIRHDLVCDVIRDYVEMHTPFRIKDESHVLGHEGARWVGAFQVGIPNSPIDWAICGSNSIDYRGGLSIHSGVVFSDLDLAMSFHETREITKRKTRHDWEIKALVNENLEVLREHFNLEDDRREHYMKRKIDRAESHDIICRVIQSGIVAGRVSAELLEKWHDPAPPYKPRTLWSLFILCSWMLNRLKPYELIDRTIMLHHFFDDIAKFNLKPTRWTQTRFA